MTRDLLLVLGILLSTVSQLRPDSVPVGPSEVCLLIWIGLTLGHQMIQRTPRLTPAFSRLAIFWLLFVAAQCIGTLACYAIADVHDASLFMHERIAYPLLAAISLLSVAGPDGSASDRLSHGIGIACRAAPRIPTSWLFSVLYSGFYPCISPTLQPARPRG